MDGDWLSEAFAEGLGAFVVTFFAAGALVLARGVHDFPAWGGTELVAVAASVGIAYTLAVAIASSTAQGHVNPAVSLTAWLTGRLSAGRAVAYVAAQLVGGVLAATFLVSLMPSGTLQAQGYGGTYVAGGTSALTALTWEIVVTFFLALAIFATVIDRDRALEGTLAVGAAAFLGALVATPFTGASMNPARSLGPLVYARSFAMQWVYAVGPVLGAALAGALYEGVLQPE